MDLRMPRQHRDAGDGRTSAAGLAAGLVVAALVVVVPAAVPPAAGGVSPAVAAVAPACPEPFPIDEVAAGQSVTGLTVSRGTTPEELTGEVIGRVENGLLPGIDLVMVRLSSAEVDRVGVWSGMSGSPVYAADGRLIGAVAYGFSYSPSPVAGVVPAAPMLELVPPDAGGRGLGTPKVDLPGALARRIVAAGDATEKQVAEGLRPLRVPLSVSGASGRTARALEERLDSSWVRVVRSAVGRAPAAAEIPVTAGGNLVATLSYGDVTVGAVGTATVVCGRQVVGFGHPLLGAGSTRLGLHGAEAVYVQEDVLFPGYKVANVGAPVGTIRQDRHVGVAGPLGEVPGGPVVTTTVTRGDQGRTGRTEVYFRPLLADAAAMHVGASIDRALGLGGGTARTRLTLAGALPGGRSFAVRRHDRYTSGALSFVVADEVSTLLLRLQRLGASVSRVDLTTSVDRTTTRAVVRGVSIRRNGRWLWIARGGRLTLPAGGTALLRATMQRTTGGATWPELLRVRVPARGAGASGLLRVVGGGSGFLDRTEETATAGGLVAALRSDPGNADVVAHLSLPREAGGTVQDRAAAGLVVLLADPFSARVRVR